MHIFTKFEEKILQNMRRDELNNSVNYGKNHVSLEKVDDIERYYATDQNLFLSFCVTPDKEYREVRQHATEYVLKW